MIASAAGRVAVSYGNITRLEPENKSRRWLRGMCSPPGIKGGETEIRTIIHEAPVFEPDCKMIIEVDIGAGSINECSFILAADSERSRIGKKVIPCWIEV